MAESGGTGLPMNVDPDNGGRTDAVAPEDQNVQYNVPTNNRFAILPIPIPGASTLRTPSTPKVRKPPAFHVFEPVNSIRSRLPASMNIVIQNQRNCVNVWPNTIAQHKLLYDQFKQWNWNFHTQSPEPLESTLGSTTTTTSSARNPLIQTSTGAPERSPHYPHRGTTKCKQVAATPLQLNQYLIALNTITISTLISLHTINQTDLAQTSYLIFSIK